VLLAAAGPAAAATTTLTARASAANEVPTPGPAGATASATFTIDTSSGQVCYTATASGLPAPAAAHIHKGASGVAGPVVVPLDASKINGGARTCLTADTALVADIVANPANYYFNVHTPEFSAGAARGQLTAAPTGASAGSGGAASEDSAPVGAAVLVILAGAGLLAVSGRRLARR
jgi:hypothetical protein